MKWLLDTNVVSENVRRRPNRHVLDWVAQRLPNQIAISAVTMAELQDGAASETNEARRHELLEWIVTEIAPSLGRRMLPITTDILVDWIRLGRALAAKRLPRATPDTLIASTARVHELIVVSRNLRDFVGTGIIIYNPWTDEMHQMEDA